MVRAQGLHSVESTRLPPMWPRIGITIQGVKGVGEG